MNTITLRLLKGASVALAGALLTACAAMKAEEATSKEQLLAAAGFKMQLANTPEKLAHLKSLTQQKIVVHEKDGIKVTRKKYPPPIFSKTPFKIDVCYRYNFYPSDH